MTDGQVVRFAFPQPCQVAADFVHYDPKVGYLKCNSSRDKGGITKKALCCQALSEAKPRRALFVFTYPSADPKTGKLPPKTDVSIVVKIMRASPALWNEVKRVIDEDSNFYSYDFLMGKNPNEKAYSVGVASRKTPQWRTIETAAMESLKAAAENKNALTKALGKTLTDRELQNVLSGTTRPAGNMNDLSSL